MIAKRITVGSLALLLVLGCGANEELERGYSVLVNEATVSDGTREDQSFDTAIEVDVFECEEENEQAEILTYGSEALLNIQAEVLSEASEFARPLVLQITDLVITFTALDGVDEFDSLFIDIPQRVVSFDEGSVSMNVGRSGTEEFEFVVPMVSVPQKDEFVETTQERLGGISFRQQASDGVGIYAYPRYRVRYDIFGTDNFGSDFSTTFEGVFEFGDFIDDQCETGLKFDALDG